MPHKKRMRIGKEAKLLSVEFLVRIVLASLLLVFLVIKPGASIARSFFGGDSSIDSMNDLSSSLNQNGEGITAIRMDLEVESAIFGFSKDAPEMRCYGCLQRLTPKPSYSYLARPGNLECKNSACLCVCKDISSGKILEREGEEGLPLFCKKIICQTLRNDLPQKTSLKQAYPSSTLANYPYWQGGFLYENSKDILNGYPTIKGTVFSVTVERKQIGENLFSNSCMAPVQCFEQN